jgi:hypothetical protein
MELILKLLSSVLNNLFAGKKHDKWNYNYWYDPAKKGIGGVLKQIHTIKPGLPRLALNRKLGRVQEMTDLP